MQTFLPYASFVKSARVLDRQRLGKQRVEAWQILKTLRTHRAAWRNHPAVRMWASYEWLLAMYGVVMCEEWRNRGYKDTLLAKFTRIAVTYQQTDHLDLAATPDWLGKPSFHKSHRSNLLRKLPAHYRRFWPRLRDDLAYVWPVTKESTP